MLQTCLEWKTIHTSQFIVVFKNKGEDDEEGGKIMSEYVEEV